MNPPAGFWRRYAAYSLDAAVLALLALPLLWSRLTAGLELFSLGLHQLQMRLWELIDQSLDSGAPPMTLALDWAADPALRAGIDALAVQLLALGLTVSLTLFLLAAAWFITSESSRWQASPGKRLAGLRVTDTAGARCGPGRIAGRFAAGIVSWLLLNLGHAVAAWTPGKRALHDYLAGTRVELAPGAAATMPRWARSWLLLQGAAFFASLSWLLVSYAQLLVEASAGGLG
jgi:uncharacterized RDD family membrane protein YckC